jgi:Ca2+-binding RTX toxin-like protein
MAQQAKAAYFKGLAGDDHFLGSHGNDVFDGGPGNDSANMWVGDDTCISVEVIDDASCDHVS